MVNMKKYKTTDAFPEPNYTQTPNDFFEMLSDMESSEVRVTLVMIRQTFGFHKETFKMGIGKLALAAGISEGAAKDGAKAAEKRGTFRRINPNENKEAEWELIVNQPLTHNHYPPEDQPLTHSESTIDPLSGVKEKKEKKEKKESAIFSEKDLEDINKRMEFEIGISQFPGAKREARIASIQSYLGETFHRNTETKEWRKFAQFIDAKQQEGQDVKVFVKWLLGQKGYDPQFWPVSKMMEFWPSAFVEKEEKVSHDPREGRWL
jgi:hypothetical protein